MNEGKQARGLLFLLFMFSFLTPSPFFIVLIPNFSVQPQQYSNWCWLACAVSIYNFYSPSTAQAQGTLLGIMLRSNVCSNPGKLIKLKNWKRTYNGHWTWGIIFFSQLKFFFFSCFFKVRTIIQAILVRCCKLWETLLGREESRT